MNTDSVIGQQQVSDADDGGTTALDQSPPCGVAGLTGAGGGFDEAGVGGGRMRTFICGSSK